MGFKPEKVYVLNECKDVNYRKGFYPIIERVSFSL